jgi:hypothetical protein
VGNWITRRMTRLPSGEIRGNEPEPNLLGLGFAVSSVGDGGSDLWYGLAGWSLIVKLVVPRVRGSTAGDPLSSSIVHFLLGPATVNRVMPSGGPGNRPRSTCDLGWKGTPNGGSGGLGSDDPIDLGGDGYIGQYCGGSVVVLGPLLLGCRRR